MSSFFTPLLHLPLLFLVSPRVSQIQYRIDNARNRIGGMVLHFMFLFHVSFCDLLRLFRSRIQVVENIRRELFSQYRSVSNDARVMVDKSYTINSAYGIHTEYRIYTVRLQQLPELVPCVVRAQASLTVCRGCRVSLSLLVCLLMLHSTSEELYNRHLFRYSST